MSDPGLCNTGESRISSKALQHYTTHQQLLKFSARSGNWICPTLLYSAALLEAGVDNDFFKCATWHYWHIIMHRTIYFGNMLLYWKNRVKNNCEWMYTKHERRKKNILDVKNKSLVSMLAVQVACNQRIISDCRSSCNLCRNHDFFFLNLS